MIAMNYQILTKYPDEKLLAAWQEFLADAACPTHYITPGFFTDPFIRGGERFAVLALEKEKITAVLTGVEAGKTIVSGLPVRPQIAFRKNTDRISATKSLVEGMLDKGGAGVELINFHSREPLAGIEKTGFTAERCSGGDTVVMLDLARGAEALFRDFSQTRQNEIRKAMKNDRLLIKDVETGAELNELYEIHLDWNKSKNTEPDAYEDFAQASRDKDYRKTLIAVYDGKVIAGTFFRFCAGGMVEYAGNNSLAQYQKLRPNPLIGWRAIEWACAGGFTHFSMGASHEFLRRFGGEITGGVCYTLDRTFLKRHEKKEKLKKLAVNTYLSLPVSARQRIKQALGKS